MNISRGMELALAQITDMTMEMIQLRCMWEGEREHRAFLEGEVERLEQQVDGIGIALNDRGVAFERMEKMRDEERARADAAESLLRSAAIERNEATCENCDQTIRNDPKVKLCGFCARIFRKGWEE